MPVTRKGSFIAACGLLILCCALPFLNHALHVDCHVYLMGADIIQQHPLRPLSHTTGYLGHQTPYHRGVNSHPQGLPFYLAAVRSLTGAESEAALHLVMIPFLILLGFGVWSLAGELNRSLRRDAAIHPGWAALIMLSAAPTIIISHSIMTDVPFIALFIAGLAMFMRAHRRGGLLPIGAALLLLNYAWFMQYRGLLLLPLGAGLLLLQGGRPPLRSVLLLLSIPALFGGWCAWNMWELGETHFFFSSGQIDYGAGRLVHTSTGLLASAGGLLLPLGFLAAWRLRRQSSLLAANIAVSVSLGAVLPQLLPEHLVGPRWLIGALVAAGTFVVGGSATSAWCCGSKTPWARPLAVTIAALFALQCVVALFGCPRMLLLVLPFLVLGLLLGAPLQRGGLLLAGVVAANLLIALPISFADMAYANAYREVALKIARPEGSSGRGYFVAEWGLRAYLEQRGLTYLTKESNAPRMGDHVVIPQLSCPWPIHPDLKKRLGQPRMIALPGSCVLRTMDPALGVGLHTDGYGVLPYGLSSSDRPYDLLRVYPVVR